MPYYTVVVKPKFELKVYYTQYKCYINFNFKNSHQNLLKWLLQTSFISILDQFQVAAGRS